jgi:ADP-ribose pyrophosphatase
MDYKIIDRKQFYKGKLFNLQKVHVRLPDGRQPVYELLDHPGAVAMIARDVQDNILFVRQFRAGVGGELLEIPAGTLHKGEEPSLCAERELREEIGMAARSLKKLGQFYLAPGYSSELLHVFLASDLYPSPLAQDADEYMKIVPIPILKVYQMISRGEFHDGKTLAAFLLAQPYLQESQ